VLACRGFSVPPHARVAKLESQEGGFGDQTKDLWGNWLYWHPKNYEFYSAGPNGINESKTTNRGVTYLGDDIPARYN
jgi:hypothetical protein